MLVRFVCKEGGSTGPFQLLCINNLPEKAGGLRNIEMIDMVPT